MCLDWCVYRRHHGVDESLISALNLAVKLFLSLLSIFLLPVVSHSPTHFGGIPLCRILIQMYRYDVKHSVLALVISIFCVRLLRRLVQ